MELAQNQWYVVLASAELRRKPLGAERLGRRLVFWRDSQGGAHAHLDRCPHLGAALSAGTIRGDTLVCPFHGFAFDGAGACRHIPANGCAGRIPAGMALSTFVLREEYGFIWLWLGQPMAEYPVLPFFPELAQGWRYRTDIADWPVHYTRAIEISSTSPIWPGCMAQRWANADAASSTVPMSSRTGKAYGSG